MKNIKIIHFTDLHLTEIQPRYRVDDFPATCIKKIERVFEIANQKGINTICFTGDFSHYKGFRRTFVPYLGKFIDIRRKHRLVNFYAIAGNHDLEYDRIDSLEGLPLGILDKAGIINLLRDGDIIDLQDSSGQVVPVKLTGFNYKRFSEEILKKDLVKSNNELMVGMIHQYVEVQDMQGASDSITMEQLKAFGLDLVLAGHCHIPDFTKDYFLSNPGAITRGTLDIDNVDRKSYINIINIFWDEGRKPRFKIEPLEVSELSGEQIFKINSKVVENNILQTIQVEMQRLRDFAELKKSADIFALVEEWDIAPEIKPVVLEYLNQAKNI